MSDWFTETNDWRKQAAMTAVNDLDIEKAVYDQATGFVENKLAPLMKGDHPLGFEIVKKNDDNTRIVGVFAFKIDKSLLFAPVFFINGEIKGPLLYRCDTKTFVPANKEWAEYLISSREMVEGKGRDRSRRFENPPLVQMQRISFLPSDMKKRAAAEDAEEIDAATYRQEFNNAYNETMRRVPASVKVKESDGKAHKIEGTPASGKTRGHAKRDGRTHALKVVRSISKEAAAALEKEQEDAPVKEIKVKATKVPGKYDVPGSEATDKKQPETTVGTLKVASYEDGTIRMRFENEDLEFLTQDGAYDIQHKQAASIQCGADGILLDEEATAQVKQAFLTDVVDDNTAAVYDALLSKADYIDKSAALLKGLLADPTYGAKATELLLKVASADFDFAERLARLCNGKAEELFSPVQKIEKQASAEVPELALVYDQDSMSKEAAVSKEYFRDGFFIQDTRPEETLSVIYETSPSNITTPSGAGEYAVVTNSGSLEKDVFVARQYSGKLGEESDSEACGCCPTREDGGSVYAEYNPFRSQPANVKYILIKDKKVKVAKNVLAIPSLDASLSSVPGDEVREGHAYMLLSRPGNVLMGPVAIKSIKEVDGIKYCQAAYDRTQNTWDDRLYIYTDWVHPLTINPDAQTDLSDMVIGKDTKFIEVEMKQKRYDDSEPVSLATAMKGNLVSDRRYDVVPLELEVGSAASVDNFIFDRFGAPKVKINKVLFGEEDTTPKFTIEAFSKKSSAMPKVNMMVKLARDMNLSASNVYDIMEKVAANGSHEFYIDGLNKTAAQLHLVDSPQFDEKFSSEFGVPIQPTKVYHLRTQGIQMFEPPSRIGDAMNPTTSTGLPDLTVTTTAPEDLRALADTYSLPNVFDHAAVGVLADSFNAMALMNRYIPSIEDAVDALGRIKFLFYWLPEDFEKAYGQDDMINIEAQIDAQFTALGSLLIKLLKKSDALKKSDGTEHTNNTKEKE